MARCTLIDVDVLNHANFQVNLNISLQDAGGKTISVAFEIHMALTPLPCASVLASDSSFMFLCLVSHIAYSV
jgi:hypothetical protein